MGHSPPLLLKTELRNRTLWYDGDSTVPVNKLISMIAEFGSHIDNVFVDEIDKDVESYNGMVPRNERISVKTELKTFDYGWRIPDEYKTLDVEGYVIDKLSEEISNRKWSDREAEVNKRALRVSEEMNLFKKYQMLDIIRMLIFVINRLESQNIVWGIGRGSSVSSYVLYLIGVHDIDSVEFDLDIREFLHT